MQQKSQFIIRQQLSNPDKYSLDAENAPSKNFWKLSLNF